jgi:hypothetical protein
MIDLHQRRRAAARAFIGQALKKGRAWAGLTYVYDKEQDDVETRPGDAETTHSGDMAREGTHGLVLDVG